MTEFYFYIYSFVLLFFLMYCSVCLFDDEETIICKYILSYNTLLPTVKPHPTCHPVFLLYGICMYAKLLNINFHDNFIFYRSSFFNGTEIFIDFRITRKKIKQKYQNIKMHSMST